MHKHHGTHHHRHRHEAFKHGSLEGVLAAVPVLAVLGREDLTKLAGVVRQLWDTELKDVATGGRKFSMSAPMVVGAVVIGAAVVHGVWRGLQKADQEGKQQDDDEPNFRGREASRRTYQRSAGRSS